MLGANSRKKDFLVKYKQAGFRAYNNIRRGIIIAVVLDDYIWLYNIISLVIQLQWTIIRNIDWIAKLIWLPNNLQWTDASTHATHVFVGNKQSNLYFNQSVKSRWFSVTGNVSKPMVIMLGMNEHYHMMN